MHAPAIETTKASTNGHAKRKEESHDAGGGLRATVILERAMAGTIVVARVDLLLKLVSGTLCGCRSFFHPEESGDGRRCIKGILPFISIFIPNSRQRTIPRTLVATVKVFRYTAGDDEANESHEGCKHLPTNAIAEAATGTFRAANIISFC